MDILKERDMINKRLIPILIFSFTLLGMTIYFLIKYI